MATLFHTRPQTSNFPLPALSTLDSLKTASGGNTWQGNAVHGIGEPFMLSYFSFFSLTTQNQNSDSTEIAN